MFKTWITLTTSFIEIPAQSVCFPVKHVHVMIFLYDGDDLLGDGDDLLGDGGDLLGDGGDLLGDGGDLLGDGGDLLGDGEQIFSGTC